MGVTVTECGLLLLLCLPCIDAEACSRDKALNNKQTTEETAECLAAENVRLAEMLRTELENYQKAERRYVKLTDELRQLTDELTQEKEKTRLLEMEIREITIRLEEAELFALKEGKHLIVKVQRRVRDLVAELETEAGRVRGLVNTIRDLEAQIVQKDKKLNETVLDLRITNAKFQYQMSEKEGKLETLGNLNHDLQKALTTYKTYAKQADKESERLATENTRLADELKQTQENNTKMETMNRKQIRKQMSTIQDLTTRLREANQFALEQRKQHNAREKYLEADFERKTTRMQKMQNQAVTTLNIAQKENIKFRSLYKDAEEKLQTACLNCVECTHKMTRVAV